jgi:hypothetical protein
MAVVAGGPPPSSDSAQKALEQRGDGVMVGSAAAVGKSGREAAGGHYI